MILWRPRWSKLNVPAAEGWATCKLVDACDAVDYGFTASSAWTPVGPRFLRITDIVSGEIDWNAVPYVACGDDLAGKYRLRDGDLVVARTGASTGVSAYVKAPPDAVFASYLVRLKASAGYDSRFLAYYLKSEQFWTYMRGVLGDKSAQPNASASTIVQAPLSAPTAIDEQRRIAAILGSFDDKVEVNRRMNAVIDELSLTELDYMCAGPQTSKRSLGSLMKAERRVIDPQIQPSGRFEHYSLPAFDAGKVPTVQSGSEIKSAKLAVPAGAVLVSKLNPRIVRVWLPLRPASDAEPIASTEFIVLTPRPPASAEFLYTLWRLPSVRAELVARVTGTTGSHQRVHPGDVLAADVDLPKDDAIRAFNEFAEPLFRRYLTNLTENKTLNDLRDTLLPELLSGRLRPKDPEAHIAPGAVL